MSGWVPFDADGWPELAQAIPQPWPRAAAVFDLRWHADQARADRPPYGRPHWRARWGWTDWAVKTLLRSGDWLDPSTKAPPADRQRTASRPPADRQPHNGQTSPIADIPPARRQPTASAPPADRHTRVDPPSPSPSPSENTDMWVEALEAYHQAQKALGKRASSLKRSKGLGKVLWGLVKAHGLDDLRTVLVWWSTSSHKRARYLRAEGYGLKTIKRNWDEYLELATEPPSTAPDDGWEFPEDIDNAHWGREKHG